MRFCPGCGNVMGRQMGAGIVFVCEVDGTTVQGGVADLRFGGGGGDDHSTRVADLHQATLQHAARDPTTTRVAHPCPDCNLPYLRQAVVGAESATVFYLCDCGFSSAAKDYPEDTRDQGSRHDGSPAPDGASESKE